MAEIYVWCKDLPVVDYKDEEGNEYCTFHAPRGKKGMSVERFNEEVFKRINEIKRLNSTRAVIFGSISPLRACDLSGVVFEGDINFGMFHKDNPLPGVNFSNAIFGGETYFSIVMFSEDAIFHGSTFSKKADLQLAIFAGKAYFQKVIFGDQTYFTQTTFNEEAGFSTATFNGEAYFQGATFNGKVGFFETKFKDDIYFCNTNIKKMVKFEKANLKKIFFMDTDLRKTDFINCEWHKKFGRNILYDELKLFSNKMGGGQGADKSMEGFLNRLKQEWIGLKKDISCDKEKIKKVEILYRLLKQKYKEEHDELEVSSWHYGEKEMFRKGNRWRRFLPSISTLYWLSSGYGERPVRAGITLFLLIIAISVLFGLTGIKLIDNSSVIKINELPADIWNLDYLKATIEYATFESKPTFIPDNWFLKIAAKLLIPLQAALFALALRNRFRR